MQFTKGDLVYDTELKLQGKLVTIFRDGKTAKIEVIVGFENRIRSTKFEKVEIKNLRPARNGRKPQRQQKQPLQIKVKYFDKEIPKLEKIDIGDWVDLRASETVELKQFEYKLIPLGVGMKVPKGYETNIVPRSSTFKNFGILQTNSFGVLDESYCGNSDQFHFPALAMRDTVIQKGERICQMRINRKMPTVEFIEVEFLDEVSRGGIGSTGTK